MLEEIKHYNNLGTPKYFFELAHLLVRDKHHVWTAKNIQKYFFNRVIEGRSVFDGCIYMAIQIGFIEVGKHDCLLIPENLQEYLANEKSFADMFVERLLAAISKHEECYEIFSHLKYDLRNKSITISNNAFGVEYSQLKQILLDFKVLKPVSTEVLRYYIVSDDYMSIFQTGLMAEIKHRVTSPEDLKLILELQSQYGEEAERFVLEYELNRLSQKNGILWVAEYSVSEGYDIASFNSRDSICYDRFIEVKSYSQTPSFYWTKNEIETAKIKGDKYFVYLVNREKLSHSNYSPMVICNPAKEIFDASKWALEVDKYYIQLI
jgi:hypothetical protein